MTVHVPAQWLPEPELLDSLDTAALAVGIDGKVRHANLVATTAYAGPGGTLVGRPLTELFSGCPAGTGAPTTPRCPAPRSATSTGSGACSA